MNGMRRSAGMMVNYVYRLSEVERNRVRNLSEDLYSLVEPPPSAQPMTSQAQAKLNEALEARQRGEWEEALDLPLRPDQLHRAPHRVQQAGGIKWFGEVVRCPEPDGGRVLYRDESEDLLGRGRLWHVDLDADLL